MRTWTFLDRNILTEEKRSCAGDAALEINALAFYADQAEIFLENLFGKQQDMREPVNV